MDPFVARTGPRLAATFALIGALVLALAAGCGTDTNPQPLSPPDAGPDAGTPDAGTPDAGTPDAGTPDAGFTFKYGEPSPWGTGNAVYGSAQGIQESPVVGVTTDEKQNLWVATHTALYLMKPGEKAFKRYSSKDGLHLMDNPVVYANETLSTACGSRVVTSTGGAADPGIVTLEGGAADEVFVGYAGQDEMVGDCNDPGDARHSGKIDRVRLKADGTLQVDRLDLASVNAGMQYWHNRTVHRLVYDHGQIWGKPTHHGYLWAGANHGVVMIRTSTIRLPRAGEWPDNANREWMGDHVHASVCFHDACPANITNGDQRMGEWRGLAIDSDGDVWHAGRWAAGKITWTEDPAKFTDIVRTGSQIFSFAFGDPIGSNPPVFFPPQEGDSVSLTAVAVTPDGHAWFGNKAMYSGVPTCAPGTKGGCAAPDNNYGVAVFDPKKFAWTRYGNTGEVGMQQQEVQDIVALPDGRVVFAGTNTGLTIYDPAKKTHVNVRASGGLIPSDEIWAMELDDMVVPPALHVATAGGAAVIRVFPQ